ncbi:hypothetical protein HOO65_070529 [Ceratocystis lukuohia]|uniref:Uncharacterized protein n=1 Tax=Ceratocystis lukuohia TaxID=2019550 RepID=A0ABR4MCS8_9PEZI
MVSFFGLKLGGDKKKKSQPSNSPDSSTKSLRRLDQGKSDAAKTFGSPNGASTWDGTPVLFMNGTATASLVDLQSFDHIPRPNRDSIRHTPETEARPGFASPDRFSMKPRAAVGAVGISSPPSSSRPTVRPSTSSGAHHEPLRRPSFSSFGREQLLFVTPREPSLPNQRSETGDIVSLGDRRPSNATEKPSLSESPVKYEALDSLFSGDEGADEVLDNAPKPPPMATSISVNTAIPSQSEMSLASPMHSSPVVQSLDSPAHSYMSASSSRTHGPNQMTSTSPLMHPNKGPQPGAFKPYSPAVALNGGNPTDRMRSPSVSSSQMASSSAPTFNESLSVQRPTLDTSTISTSGSPVISESPFSQFNFEFDLGPSSSLSSPSKSAVSTPATEVMSIMDRKDSFSRASTTSPSPSLTLISSHESVLSSRPSVSKSTSIRSTPSPSHSVRSARSIERPSFEKSVSTKPVAPSGLRVVRNAIPSIVPDTSGLGIAADRSSFVAKLQRTNFGARSPTPESEFVLHGDEALALQWEGPPVIRDVAAKRDTLTISSPRRQSFSFNLDSSDHNQGLFAGESQGQMSPERPKTSAGPATDFSRGLSGSPTQRARRASGGASSNSRLDAIRPSPLKIGTTTAKLVQAMPKSPLSVAPQQATLQTHVVPAQITQIAQVAELGMFEAQSAEVSVASHLQTTSLKTSLQTSTATGIATDQASIASPATESSFTADSAIASPALESPASAGTVANQLWPARVPYDSIRDKNGYAVPNPRGAPVAKSPVYQTSALPLTSLSHGDSSPLPPARHPGRGNVNADVPRASAWHGPSHPQRPKLVMPQDKFMSPRPAVQPPVSAVTQNTKVIWPSAGETSSPNSSLGTLDKNTSEASHKRENKAQESVRDRVRNLEVQDRNRDRSRSPQAGYSSNGSRSPISGPGVRRDASLLHNRPPPRPVRDDSVGAIPVSVTGDGFI